jgi:hypothetical protein
MSKMTFLVLTLLIAANGLYAQSIDRYRAAHGYFASRSFDAESITVILVAVVLLTFFAAYLAVNLLFKRHK